ncbi:MAG: hypothetical protein MJE77_00660 [Proteobacteria bacterium]|nr:hypothetical protein [Pseudomonadota bacterium]
MSNSEVARQFAGQLGETEADPIAQIRLIVAKLGVGRAQELVDRARQIEIEGGTMTRDGSRRRTLGGVFFSLAREQIGHPMTPHPAQRLPWKQAVEIALDAAASEGGEATSVKIVLIGRPGQVVKRDKVVVTTMYNLKRPSLPKQLPKLSGADVETPYTVFITAKHWRKVAEPLNSDREDRLIVEGYPFLDPDIKGICVFAKSATTTALQRALREQQRARATETGKQAGK